MSEQAPEPLGSDTQSPRLVGGAREKSALTLCSHTERDRRSCMTSLCYWGQPRVPMVAQINSRANLPCSTISIAPKGVSCSTVMMAVPLIWSPVVYVLAMRGFWPTSWISILGREGRVQASVLELRLVIEVIPIASKLASSVGSKAEGELECGTRSPAN